MPRVTQKFPDSDYDQPIYVHQSPASRAVNVGYLKGKGKDVVFIPARLNFGVQREIFTYQATIESFQTKPIQTILKRFQPDAISTITVLRETLACHLGQALRKSGIDGHYGDAFIGATHIKGEGDIKTAYLYENTEGLVPDGLWILADSICIGRNSGATLNSLLKKFHPKEIIVLAPIASRRGINAVGEATSAAGVPTTFLAWGALFGVDEKTLYDMPWGHESTEPLDSRDQDLVVSMYGRKLCMGGDFGNDYYCPSVAKKLYEEQLATHGITPNIPDVFNLMTRYSKNEFLTR